MDAIVPSPWLQLFVQLGSFGLLAYVVTVLYPKVRKEERDEREHRDEVFAGLINMVQDRADRRSDEVIRDGKDRWQILADAIRQQTLSINTAQTMAAGRIEEAVKTVCKHGGHAA